MRFRLRALFACFSSSDPSVRGVAAELLQRYRSELGPFARLITTAFRIETDRGAKERLGVLLAEVLHDLQKRNDAPQPKP